MNNENLEVPSDFQVTEENIKRFFKAYGDGFNTGKGVGDARVVTANILHEYKSRYCNIIDSNKLIPHYLDAFDQVKHGPQIECVNSTFESKNRCHSIIIDQYLANPNEAIQLQRKLRVREIKVAKTKDDNDVTPESLKGMFNAVSEEFQKRPRLPIEIVHGGNGLNSTRENATPIKDNRQRQSHVSLITGRRLTAAGECQILIRNSQQTRCNPRTGVGNHIFTDRECEGETDSTWFTESHVSRFIGAVRITNPPVHPAARNILAKEK